MYVAPPPPNVIHNNIHNTVVINNTTNTVTITNPRGQTQTVTPAQALAPQPAAAEQSTQGSAPTAPAPVASTEVAYTRLPVVSKLYIHRSVVLPLARSKCNARPRTWSCSLSEAAGLPPPSENRPTRRAGPVKCGAFESVGASAVVYP